MTIEFDPAIMERQRRKQSKKLKDFYVHWLKEAARPDIQLREVTSYGLCTNLITYCALKSVEYCTIYTEMSNQFAEFDLCGDYPLGKDEYKIAGTRNTMHEDPDRLAWVRLHISESNT